MLSTAMNLNCHELAVHLKHKVYLESHALAKVVLHILGAQWPLCKVRL